jgi:hypothetical protein
VIRRPVVLCALAVSVLGGAQGPAPQFATRDVRKLVGKEFTVCGRTAGFDCSTSGDLVLLDFARPGGFARFFAAPTTMTSRP